ncbi:ROK family protein [Mycoplasma sp. T363T]|uniref:ROK family protein n=1 Tax=Mycoplasma bradburyae TaxID=2963128 RepID=A0AAW6HS57_9MOLU|nr:ROK family protein [Mycoplasma bradburyae]MDC4163399.1 ROK family protein [Mycoplasma bradburyae]MDC4182015.1 ROK family protein [Mycoplasma bradburyae]MDC4183389.1 ROK family protein [Mycoplasma bradburyae]UTS70440.1 ROK family protein [Mycoplasma bradburyae]UTS71162.1 ROK family protein [Mycoplasma bradburyae]
MNNKIYLCFDVGATSVKYAYIDSLNLSIIKKGSFETKNSKGLFEKEMLITNLVKQIDLATKNYEIVFVGIATFGGVNIKTKTIIYTNESVKEYLHTNWDETINNNRQNKIDVVVLNDIKACSLAEFAKKDNDNGIMVTLGTGFGVCLYSRQDVYYGANYLAGEIGVLKILDGVDQDIDTACSAVITTNKIKAILKIDNLKLTDHNLINVNEQAKAIKQEWINNIVKTFKIINAFYDPEIFIIGGGVSSDELIINEIKNNLPLNFNKEVVGASLGNDAAFYGLIEYYQKHYK